ncbi:hypothetical protein CH276_14195 [Rhodococcus sp. 06-470-2]|nr:hypothetical protein CH276_14195 [Rhodococcus sp. 06-470-2]OZE71742.1 hypothetical protein CH265_01675 [Rhodococcus sp. 05-2221-1B]
MGVPINAANAKRDWYRIQNKADDDGPAEIYIYDEIGESFWGGISANQFARDLAEITADEITVHINSPGGFAYDGIAILNALRGHKAKVTTIVDGLAASAASMIAMAGEVVVMNRNSQMMIHDPNGVCVGNPKDMADYAAYLDKMGENIASIYAERAGGDNAEWRTAMQAETWYSAEEAVDAGLADRVEGTDADAEQATNKFDLTIFNYAGRRAAPNPANLTPRPKNSSATEAGDAGKEGTVPTLKEGLAERFGFDVDADDETALSAVDEALAEQTSETGGAADANGEPTPSQVSNYARKHGLTIVDQAQYDEVVASASQGREARNQQLRDSDEALVTNAIKDGKFPPARREHWLTALAADRDGMTQVINDLPKGLVPVAEIGHGQNESTDVDEVTNIRESDAYKGLEGF